MLLKYLATRNPIVVESVTGMHRIERLENPRGRRRWEIFHSLLRSSCDQSIPESGSTLAYNILLGQQLLHRFFSLLHFPVDNDGKK